MEYIDKSALVAEIEKIISDETESIKSFEHNKNASEVQRSNARIGVLTYLRSLLDTLEVKEVDLEKEIDGYMTKKWEGIEEDKRFYDMMKNNLHDIAKHFFELGMSVSNKAQKGE